MTSKPVREPGHVELSRSSRDLEQVRQGLRRFLEDRLGPASEPAISYLQATSATGMSSETMVFDASWTERGQRHTERLVARVAPLEADVPVFPAYDMRGQFTTIQTVSKLTDVPVPPPLWCETDPGYLGSPFFVMGYVEGRVPADVLPYNFGDNWLYDADPADQRRLQDATVGVLARLHALPEPKRHLPHLMRRVQGREFLRSHVADRWEWYQFAARDTGRSHLVEQGFRWLEDHWPRHEPASTFCWGDARIGNVLYRDFEPAAVLDWEMASIAPPETDLAWLAYLHRVFEDHASSLGLPGMPHFLEIDSIATTYERLTGRTPAALDWCTAYAAVQLGIVFLRTGYRQVRFGERQAPSDPDEFLLNAVSLRALVGG
jgi:aminoglycoside phosphotransferase (APT) family kinase protein